jgi:hypothetical protein
LAVSSIPAANVERDTVRILSRGLIPGHSFGTLIAKRNSAVGRGRQWSILAFAPDLTKLSPIVLLL